MNGDGDEDDLGLELPQPERANGGIRQPKVPMVKLAKFFGDPRLHKEWKNECQAMKLIYGIGEKSIAGLVHLALAKGEGMPRDLLSHLGLATDSIADDGCDKIWAPSGVEYLKKEYLKADGAKANYEKQRRRPYQPMNQLNIT